MTTMDRASHTKYFNLGYLVCVFFSLCFISSVCYSKAPTLADLLRYSTPPEDQLITFIKEQGNKDTIIYTRMYFLASDDCYSGSLAFFETKNNEESFHIKSNTPFSLNAYAVYNASKKVVEVDDLEKIRSVLIRFYIPNYKLVKFLGSCQDQQINCCIPVVCSNSLRACMPKYELEPQSIALD